MAWVDGVDGRTGNVGSTMRQTVVDGVLTLTGDAGTPCYDVILHPVLMRAAWAQYRVQPPLSRVWAGDDPANPTQTVQLQFPDQATAEQVLSTLLEA